jgi:UDP-2,4-diacetamido-2,4,6-trideoxy-beta-L-altropyranose hydrolase
MENMRALIFTEGGTQIGFGHISRCSSLYDELDSRGIEVQFVIFGDLSEISMLENKNYQVVDWQSTSFLNDYIKENDYCIVDSYLASEDLYNVISNRAKQSVFIDDNGRIQYPEGIVVNPSLYTKAVKYLKNDTNCFLLGSQYIILRKPFIQVKREMIHPQVKEVIITLGGTDIHNLTPLIVTQLCSKYPDILFNVVVRNALPSLEEMKSNVKVYENLSAEEMQSTMLKSDLAITAAGQTIHELIATQTPFIPIKVAENQSNNMIGLKELNLVELALEYNDDFFIEKIQTGFEKMLNYNVRNTLANQYLNVVDGLGSKRIIDALIKVGYDE